MLVELKLSRIIGLKYVLCCFYWIYLGNFFSLWRLIFGESENGCLYVVNVYNEFDVIWFL